MASGILGIGLSGLTAAQAGIRTTEHNIANVNTAGFRRQEVGFGALPPQFTGQGYFGTGVGVETVRRVYDQFLDSEVQLNQSQLARHEAFTIQASQIDKLLGDAGSGLSTALDSFFGAVNELANDPTADAARQVLLSAGNNLAGRINTLDSKFQNYITGSNNEIDVIAGQVNVLASRVASLNVDIGRAESVNGRPANDLRDQRDQALTDLNKLVNLSLVQQQDGSTSVYIGSGQALVVGNLSYRMSSVADANDVTLRVPTLNSGGTPVVLDAGLVTGGQLGGVLAVREQVLLPAKADVNRLAVAIAAEVNRVHRGGVQFDGVTPGGDFFGGVVNQTAGTTNWMALNFTSNPLANQNYTVAFGGANYTVTRVSDGLSAVVAAGVEVTIGGVAQGFSIAAGVPAPAAGDTWSLGFQNYADSMAVAPTLTSTSQIAAAAAGPNAGPGDNANALALAALQSARVLDNDTGILGNGTTTFSAAYNRIISRTATLASEADLNQSAFTTLVATAEADQRAVSGVNLDEEASNLIRFQQAYQASAKAIQVSAALFDDLLAIVR